MLNTKANLDLFSSFLDCNLVDLVDQTSIELSNYSESEIVNDSLSQLSTLPKIACPVHLQSSVKTRFTNFISDSVRYSTLSDAETRIVKHIQSTDIISSILNSQPFISKPSSLVCAGLKASYFIDSLVEWAINNKIKYIAFIETSDLSIASSCLVTDWLNVREKLKKCKYQGEITSKLTNL